MVRQFIEGWDLMQILGEGTFASVKLLVNSETGEACAMKEVRIGQDANSPNQFSQLSLGSQGEAIEAAQLAESVRKEICVHKLLKHPNIVQCYGSRTENKAHFIFLEYCSGGELFDRIEPEVGMPQHMAQLFFLQLLDGVEYLHSRGIAHRDIKPENLLLSENDQLKISDFGMATVFRHKGLERMMERRCGTMPYLAPEVLLKKQYHAEPADIWSCGIVLLAMIAGELPWDRPTPDQCEFQNWKTNDITKGLWTRVDSLPLALLRKVLNVNSTKRYSIQAIKNHLWCKKKFKDSDGNIVEPDLASAYGSNNYYNVTASQPVDAFKENCQRIRAKNPSGGGDSSGSCPRGGAQKHKDLVDGGGQTSPPERKNNKVRDFVAFSQPAFPLSDCTHGGSSQTQSSQSESEDGSESRRKRIRRDKMFQRLVKRMTRFWVDTTLEKTDIHLRGILEKLKYSVTSTSKGIYTIQTMDRRGTDLVFKCTFIQVDHKILLDFRLCRGCGLEFKRNFEQIKSNCGPILDKAPILWPALIPADAIPDGSQ